MPKIEVTIDGRPVKAFVVVEVVRSSKETPSVEVYGHLPGVNGVDIVALAYAMIETAQGFMKNALEHIMGGKMQLRFKARPSRCIFLRSGQGLRERSCVILDKIA